MDGGTAGTGVARHVASLPAAAANGTVAATGGRRATVGFVLALAVSGLVNA